MKRSCLLSLFFFISIGLFSQTPYFDPTELYDTMGLYKPTKYERFFSFTVETGLNNFDGDISQKYNALIPTSQTHVNLGFTAECTFTPLFGLGFEIYYLPLSAGTTTVNFSGDLYHFAPYMSINMLNLFQMYNPKWGVWATVGGGLATYNTTIYKNGVKFDQIKDGYAITMPISVLLEYNLSNTLAFGARVQYSSHNKDNLEGTNLQELKGGYNYKGVTNDYVALGAVYFRYKLGARKNVHTRNMDPNEKVNQILSVARKAEEKAVAVQDEVAALPKQDSLFAPKRDSVQTLPFTPEKTGLADDGVKNIYIIGNVYCDNPEGKIMKQLKPGKYLINVLSAKVGNDSIPIQDTVPVVIKQKPMFFVKVYDANTKAKLQAEVVVKTKDGLNQIYKKYTSPVTGMAGDKLSVGQYLVNVNCEGYLYDTENITHSKTDTLVVGLKPIETGARMTIKNLYFEFDSPIIKTSSEPTLEQLFQFLIVNYDVKIQIVGHTDGKGSVDYNQKLSDRRAKSVMNELIRRGISPDRLTCIGRGMLEPVATNSTAEGRAENRRVEIVVK